MSFRKKWFSNTVTSSDGYSLTIADRTTLLYVDGVGRVHVSAEMLAPARTWALYPDDMRVDTARGPQLADEERRALIVSRIRAVFEFLKLKLEAA
jgi:hypothetical protein